VDGLITIRYEINQFPIKLNNKIQFMLSVENVIALIVIIVSSKFRKDYRKKLEEYKCKIFSNKMA